MWQVPVVCRRMWRLESQSYPCWKTMTFVLSLSSLSPLNKTRIVLEFVQLERVADFQPCLKWEQCHQHNHSEGFELNPGQWKHLSVQSRICLSHCYKGSTEGDSEGSPVSSLCWVQPPQNFLSPSREGIGILCTWFEWYPSNTAES